MRRGAEDGMVRRSLVVVSVVAMLATLGPAWASPLDATAAPTPGPVDSGGSAVVETVPVTAGTGSLAMSTGATGTTTVRATDVEPFTMLGVSWAGPVGEARARVHADGTWGPWLDLDVEDEHAPDAGTAEPTLTRPTSAPVWVDRADGYELRIPADVAAPEVHLVRETTDSLALTIPGLTIPGLTDPAPSPVPLPPVDPKAATPDGPAAAGQPSVHRRSSWGARSGTQAPEYADELRMGFVHHTVNANGYAAADVPRMLRGIQAYHMDANGWSDIGYNLLIDRFGRVWEGRAGGLNWPVIGAHTGGLNTNSFGVALIGDFSNVGPASAAVQALVQVLGWRLGSAGVNPLGTATMTARGNNDKFTEGSVVRLPAVAGHRDGKNTACPGARLYAQLPDIRRHAEAVAFGNASPFGSVDRAARAPGGVQVEGWAIDSQADGPIPIHVQVDGRTVATATASRTRSDVAAAFPGHGSAVGYRVLVPVPAGSHDVCPVAMNTGYGNNRNLGCRRVGVATAPFGALDVVQPANGGVLVAGWAIDPDVADPVAVHIYVDLTPTAVRANRPRSDVGRAFPGYGDEHGYRAIAEVGPGRHQVCAYGIDSAGGPSTTLGCRLVDVP